MNVSDFPGYGTWRSLFTSACVVDAEIAKHRAQTERFLLQLKATRHPCAAGPQGVTATRVSHESCDTKETVTAGSGKAATAAHLPPRGRQLIQKSSPVRTADSQSAALKQPGGGL